MKQEIIQRDKPIILFIRNRSHFIVFIMALFKTKRGFLLLLFPYLFPLPTPYSFLSTLMSHVTYVPISSASFACFSWSLIQFHSLYPFSQILISIDTNTES